jgi:general nucleoside transport system permease protein
MSGTQSIGWLGVPLAIAAGAVRGSSPFLFVSLGECLTEKSGKINLGLEGTLLMGAMSGYAVSYKTGSPWIGVLVAGLAGAGMGLMHAWLSQLPRVNDIAVGIALFILGSGLAFFIGDAFIQPMAPPLRVFNLGGWSSLPQVQAALKVSPLLLLGIVLAFAMHWFFLNTRWGMFIRAVGDNPAAARAQGISVVKVRTLSIMTGSFFAGVGGAYLSLVYPGSWSRLVSSGQGLMAVALVIFARWNPRACLWASLLFGGAQAVGPALQAAGVQSYYYLFNAAPYLLTLVIMIVTCTPKHSLAGAPGALGTGE